MAQELSQEQIEAVKRGKIFAFEKMLLVFEKPIFNYIYRLAGQRQDAEDLTQEVFIKVFKNRKSIDPAKNFKSWLFKIATNTVFDWFRRKKNIEILYDEEMMSRLPETISPEPPYYLIERDLEIALKAIKPGYRTVLMLFYYQGFSYEEIGSILSLPLNTVKTHILRAKQELKKQLEKSLK